MTKIFENDHSANSFQTCFWHNVRKMCYFYFFKVPENIPNLTQTFHDKKIIWGDWYLILKGEGYYNSVYIFIHHNIWKFILPIKTTFECFDFDCCRLCHKSFKTWDAFSQSLKEMAETAGYSECTTWTSTEKNWTMGKLRWQNRT